MDNIPSYTWNRHLDAPEPSSNVHTFSRPPILEALQLLPIAYRVGSYISNERSQKREPIFDLNGIALEPPNPGPYGGVPCGGIGGGSIGRGFRGEFRRWSLHPGRYIHQPISSDVFVIRIKRNGQIYSKVLSVIPPESRSCLNSWSWGYKPKAGDIYHAVFPKAWTIYENPVPETRVIIKQISPFIPEDYSTSSLPASCFDIEVENTSLLPTEVSIMFCFQNGLNTEENHRIINDFEHIPFQNETILGITLSHTTSRDYLLPLTSTLYTSCQSACSIGSETMQTITDQVSFGIAAQSDDDGSVSICPKFITLGSSRSLWSNAMNACSQEIDLEKLSANVLWESFVNTGEIQELDPNVFPSSQIINSTIRYGGAVCCKKEIPSKNKKTFSFSLAWDFPMARFGSGKALPRYYTRFFGTSGLKAGSIASYALIHRHDWERNIDSWHQTIKEEIQKKIQPLFPEKTKNLSKESSADNNLDFYYSQIFNELYYLVDGGTLWLDSSNGEANPSNRPVLFQPHGVDRSQTTSKDSEDAHVRFHVHSNPITSFSTSTFAASRTNSSSNDQNSNNSQHQKSNELVQYPPMESKEDVLHVQNNTINTNKTLPSTSRNPLIKQEDQSLHHHLLTHAHDSPISAHQITTLELENITHQCHQNNELCLQYPGDQQVIGQFLYLEGHEYLMYNTYDVHFYASVALLMLFPSLELSLQRDFVVAINGEDLRQRQMMGEGYNCERKLKSVVPHDLGSPSETPYKDVNAYNFQDVSHWKDLGSKMILQCYRDYIYLSEKYSKNQLIQDRLQELIRSWYPNLLQVMQKMKSFDCNNDDMIENSGFPDQTYDIWIAKGVHAYCGGLWITACEAMSKFALLCDPSASTSLSYQRMASNARQVYVDSLWNGEYLHYDNSSSLHHDSIMSDMLAGQWYSRACHLPSLLSDVQIFSCLQKIYSLNVRGYGQGQWLGAVNGCRPDGSVDQTCIQSREVWTGTTYALAGTMLQEYFYHLHQQNDSSSSQEDTWTKQQTTQMLQMAFHTARGIHDAGWQRFGYWFATPEGWERNGPYRSLGYMRPLAIWALPYAQNLTPTH